MWRCRLGLHDWLRVKFNGVVKYQCKRCGARKNVTTWTDLCMVKIEAMHAAKQQDWQTPPELFLWMEKELGFKFTLDPCTSPDNPLKTDKFYTEEDDGLIQTWRGERAYINPPYGDLPKWVQKAHYESSYNDTTVVGLLPVRTSPKYMRHYVWTEYSKLLNKLSDARHLQEGEIGVYLLPKRIRFIDPNTGKKTGSPYFDSMVVVWK